MTAGVLAGQRRVDRAESVHEPAAARAPEQAVEVRPPRSIALITWRRGASGSAARTSAATPDTCGVAIEVPLIAM